MLKICMILLLLARQDDAKKKADEEADKALEQFKTTVKATKVPTNIIVALGELGKTRHSKVLAELKIWVTTKGETSDVRIAAAEQMGNYKGSKEAAEALLLAGNDQKDLQVSIKCVSFAGDTGVKALASKFVALYTAKEIDVARAAIESSAKIKSKDVIEPLIKFVLELESVKESTSGSLGGPGGKPTQPKEDENVRRKRILLEPAVLALQSVTGQKWTKGKEWEEWWKKNKGTWKEPG